MHRWLCGPRRFEGACHFRLQGLQVHEEQNFRNIGKHLSTVTARNPRRSQPEPEPTTTPLWEPHSLNKEHFHVAASRHLEETRAASLARTNCLELFRHVQRLWWANKNQTNEKEAAATVCSFNDVEQTDDPNFADLSCCPSDLTRWCPVLNYVSASRAINSQATQTGLILCTAISYQI